MHTHAVRIQAADHPSPYSVHLVGSRGLLPGNGRDAVPDRQAALGVRTPPPPDVQERRSRDEVSNCCGLEREEHRPPTCCLRHAFEALERAGTTAGDVAIWAGYVNKNRADGTRVRRLLGIVEFYPDRTPGELPVYKTSLPYQDAVTLALAMGLDPVDLGL